MSKYTITPWRTQADLLHVRKQLYSLDGADKHSRRKAVDRIMAWKIRGNLPHAVESTALLVDAILHHENSSNSSFSIRAVYSAAFTRFVTGFCDIGRHKERTLEPSSMLEIAKQIGMPVEFVGLRHEATHEELPGIQRLVTATKEALKWLWKVYWSRLEEPEDEEKLKVTLANTRKEITSILRDFRKARRDALRATTASSEESSNDIATTTSKCVEICKGSRPRIKALAGTLVDERLILPSSRQLGSPLDGAYLIWDELLQCLSSHFIGFLPALMKIIQSKLSQSTNVDPESDPDKEALAMWLLHLTTAFLSLRPDRDAILADIMKWCCLYPGYWTKNIGERLLKIFGESLEDDWEALFEASLIRIDGGSDGTKLSKQDVDDFMDGEKAGVDQLRVKDPVVGWSRATIPLPAPIGLVR